MMMLQIRLSVLYLCMCVFFVSLASAKTSQYQLEFAIRNNKISVLRDIFQKDPNAVNGVPGKQLPLHLALAHKHTDIIKMMVEEYDADVTARDETEETPMSLLQHLVSQCDLDMLQFIWDTSGHKIDVNEVKDYDDLPLLHISALASEFGPKCGKVATLLLDNGADLTATTYLNDDLTGMTPIHMAALKCNSWQLKAMLDHPVYDKEVYITDDKGNTPVHSLAMGNVQSVHCEDCATLLKSHVDADSLKDKNEDGKTAERLLFDFYEFAVKFNEENKSKKGFQALKVHTIKDIMSKFSVENLYRNVHVSPEERKDRAKKMREEAEENAKKKQAQEGKCTKKIIGEGWLQGGRDGDLYSYQDFYEEGKYEEDYVSPEELEAKRLEAKYIAENP